MMNWLSFSMKAALSKSPSMFDKQKLTWMNNQYVKKLSLDEVIELTLPHLQAAGRVSEEMTETERQWVHDLIALYHGQLSYGAEIVELTAQFFNDAIEYDEQSKEVLVRRAGSGSDGVIPT